MTRKRGIDEAFEAEELDFGNWKLIHDDLVVRTFFLLAGDLDHT